MNVFEMVVAIVLIVMCTVTMMVRAKYAQRRAVSSDAAGSASSNLALEKEVEQLRDRVKVLERIAVEKEDTLTREIEQLRER
ncbi:hypothetical protein [Sphingomicrobium lutaoense]|uniref:Putative membrane protein n=1 Tax=Sphingomicrobium lutaoense TaxID=515949 RepID=A0A839Z1P9_9SPHN|nr:hypothetical protein [Sphingomicrobium lutaoense]MBB3763653.1 putative membrane protein [Sphingomicrobium lutaoense]